MCALHNQRNGDRKQAKQDQSVLLAGREGVDEPGAGAGHDDGSGWVKGDQGKGEGGTRGGGAAVVCTWVDGWCGEYGSYLRNRDGKRNYNKLMQIADDDSSKFQERHHQIAKDTHTLYINTHRALLSPPPWLLSPPSPPPPPPLLLPLHHHHHPLKQKKKYLYLLHHLPFFLFLPFPPVPSPCKQPKRPRPP